MNRRSGSESLEIERKYEVPAEAELPSAGRFAEHGLDASTPESVELAASYLDTPERDLAAASLALRLRQGGHDAGWHLKERGSEGTRELAWPVTEDMPGELRDELQQRFGDATETIVPVASVRTIRTIVRLSDQLGSELVEVADDRVRAIDHIGGVHRAWREWEAELLPGASRDVLDHVDPVLRAAGAVPSPSVAKIARATGMLVGIAYNDGARAEVLAALAVIDLADRLAAEEPAGDAEHRIADLRRLAARLIADL